MPDHLSPYDLRRFLRELRSRIQHLKDENARPVSNEAPAQLYEMTLQDDLDAMMNELGRALEGLGDDPEPSLVLQKAVSLLEPVEAKRLLLTNLFEALKRGEHPVDVLQRYEALGLMSAEAEPVNGITLEGARRDHIDGVDPPPRAGILEVIGRKLRWLRRVAFTVMELASFAALFIGVKPSVGLVGVVPSISFEIGMETASVHEVVRQAGELFGALRGETE